jgi:hypothetical protein
LDQDNRGNQRDWGCTITCLVWLGILALVIVVVVLAVLQGGPSPTFVVSDRQVEVYREDGSHFPAVLDTHGNDQWEEGRYVLHVKNRSTSPVRATLTRSGNSVTQSRPYSRAMRTR